MSDPKAVGESSPSAEAPAAKKQPSDFRWDEYRLLQEKIDKIGAFRFQIKGWTVALATAVTLAASRVEHPFVTGAALLALYSLLYLTEYFQVHLSVQLQSRLGELEVHLRNSSSSGSPGIVRAIRKAPQGIRYWLAGKANGVGFYAAAVLVNIAAVILACPSSSPTAPGSRPAEESFHGGVRGPAPMAPSAPVQSVKPGAK